MGISRIMPFLSICRMTPIPMVAKILFGQCASRRMFQFHSQHGRSLAGNENPAAVLEWRRGGIFGFVLCAYAKPPGFGQQLPRCGCGTDELRFSGGATRLCDQVQYESVGTIFLGARRRG